PLAPNWCMPALVAPGGRRYPTLDELRKCWFLQHKRTPNINTLDVGTRFAQLQLENVRLGFRSARASPHAPDGWSERGSPRALTIVDTRRDKSPGDLCRGDS